MPAHSDDPFDLERFVTAQDRMYDVAIGELKAGAKKSHWIWYLFPQVAGLGSSAMSHRYAIRSKDEAKAYLAHPVLGSRLVECANALLTVTGKRVEDIMGSPDDLKLQSSMTLFAAVSAPDSPFQAVLDRFYSGKKDPLTEKFLAEQKNE